MSINLFLYDIIQHLNLNVQLQMFQIKNYLHLEFNINNIFQMVQLNCYLLCYDRLMYPNISCIIQDIIKYK